LQLTIKRILCFSIFNRKIFETHCTESDKTNEHKNDVAFKVKTVVSLGSALYVFKEEHPAQEEK
jgi:hypothetical protein